MYGNSLFYKLAITKLCFGPLFNFPFFSFYFHDRLKGGCAHFNIRIFHFNWLTLTSNLRFVRFHPRLASCLLSRGKRKYAWLEMRMLCKYIRNIYWYIPLNFTLYMLYRLILHSVFGSTLHQLESILSIGQQQ